LAGDASFWGVEDFRKQSFLHANGANRFRLLTNLPVSFREATIFHTLINICVENFTKQKYFAEASVRRLHMRATNAMIIDSVGPQA
jgi:hypothetical protein